MKPLLENLPKLELMPLPFSAIGEKRLVLLVIDVPVWNAVEYSLHFPIKEKACVTDETTTSWDGILATFCGQDMEVVYVSGGLAADTRKYFAARTNLPLVCLPTALLVDVFIAAASALSVIWNYA